MPRSVPSVLSQGAKVDTSFGGIPRQVLLVEKMNLTKEYYFAILMDRSTNGPAIVASNQGGMDIEAVAEATPEAIIKMPIDIVEGLTPKAAEDLAVKLGFGPLAKQASEQFLKLYELFLKVQECGVVLVVSFFVLTCFGWCFFSLDTERRNHG